MNKLIFLPLTLALSASLPAGTTAYWRLEEGVAGNSIDAALDSSGNGLNQNGKGGKSNLFLECAWSLHLRSYYFLHGCKYSFDEFVSSKFENSHN
jgi:hypothetical protein